jgi:predicted metalloprotease
LRLIERLGYGILGWHNHAGCDGDDHRPRARATPAGPGAERRPAYLAGVWMHSVYLRGAPTDANFREALDAAAVVGDDLRNAAGQPRPREICTHGSCAERQRWLKTVFVDGRPESCDTFDQ